MAFGQRTRRIQGCQPGVCSDVPQLLLSLLLLSAAAQGLPQGQVWLSPPCGTPERRGLQSPCPRGYVPVKQAAGRQRQGMAAFPAPDQGHAKPSAGWEAAAGAGRPMSCLRVAAWPREELWILGEGGMGARHTTN